MLKHTKNVVENMMMNLKRGVITPDEVTSRLSGYKMALAVDNRLGKREEAYLTKAMKDIEIVAKENEQAIKQVVKIEQRYVCEQRSFYKAVSSCGMAQFAEDIIGHNASESLLVMCLNTKNEVIAYSELFKGSLNQSIATPREIFMLAIMNNSARIALSHPHPSGNTEPSRQDEIFTKEIIKIGKMLGIELLDHIIVSAGSPYYSFREENKM